jgi:heat shock protein HtpX
MFFYNQFKTVLLLGAMSGLFLFMGNLLGGSSGLLIAAIIAMFMNFFAYFYSDTIVLRMYKAKPLDRKQYASIYEMVHELAGEMGIPMPKLWLVENKMANAFATGRNPQHSSVAVTTGILEILDKKELRGVLAHELSHVKNRDILVSTIAAVLATAIGYVATMFRYSAMTNSTDDRRRNPLVMLLISILVPIAASLIQLAISRSREFLADESGAECCKDPLALASALEKLHNHIPYASLNKTDVDKASTAPLFIVHPFAGSGWTALFSTHPPVAERIARLRAMYNQKK